MKNTSSIIIIIVVSISLFTWFVSIWQYDTMMSSMMTFYYSPVALSLFVVIWTAGMAAMMFPAIIPMVLFYNRLIDSSKGSKDNFHSHHSSQMLYHRQDDTHSDMDNNNNNNGIPNTVNQGQNKRRKIYNLSYCVKTQDLLYDDFHIIISCDLGNNGDSTPHWMVLCPRHIITTIGNK